MSTLDSSRLGESKVIARLVELGWYPFIDISGKCPVDLVAWKDGDIRTFQVKTTKTAASSGKYTVQIGCIRPNRTGNTIHKFQKSAQDYLAVYIVPRDTVIFIKSESIMSGRSLAVASSIDTVPT